MNSAVANFWNKLPVALTASMTAAAIGVAGIAPWSALAGANLKYGTAVPWAAGVQLIWLACLWAYLSGRGWPAATGARRRELLRARVVPRRLWGWTLLAAVGFACALVSSTVVGLMFATLPSTALDEFRALDQFAPHVVLPLFLTGALVAGAVEEAAFRGYLQVPLEERYGPKPAIIAVALVFTAVHLPPLPILPAFVVLAAGWGALAYLTGSILPGVVCHFSVDAVVWVWCWWDVDRAQRIFATSVREDAAMQAPFVATLSVAIASSAMAILGFWRLARALRASKTPSTCNTDR